MNFNLYNIKMAESRNGLSMSAKFHINNVYVADFIDKGDGSQPSFYFTIHPEAKKLFNEMKAKIEELPPVYIAAYDMELKIDEYLFIDLIHAAIVEKKPFKLLV